MSGDTAASGGNAGSGMQEFGGVVSAFGSLAGGISGYMSNNYNAEVARNNAAIVLQQGAAAAQQDQIRSQIVIGAMKAGYGASGVTREGSPSDVLAFSAAQAELSRQNILYNANIQAVGFSNQANRFGSAAIGDAAGGVLSAAGTLLASRGRIAAKGGVVPDSGAGSAVSTGP